ncbi:MAG TPA: DUF2071 domain-containing protein [Verrucomicrobiae bacterium]|nr:DUF2071 domain-containing protein [Verrucomicrobiae bacterium]
MKFNIPTMHGIIERRMLVNFRVRPDAVRPLLPECFHPKLVNGWAMAGICLIRLKDMRPHGFPAACGLTSENAAHRIAVEWDEAGTTREGVFIPRRDTSSTLQAFVGGRVFPGVHHAAEFTINEDDGAIRLEMCSHDGVASVKVQVCPAAQLPASSVFASVGEASEFFARGAVGYSATENPACCDGLELHTNGWQVEPLAVELVESSFFDDPSRFPVGEIHFDCALLMRNIPHEWRALPQIERHP